MSIGDGIGGTISLAARLLQGREDKVPDWYRQAIDDEGSDRLREVYKQMAERQALQLDKLSAAFILETALPPSECELVQVQEGLVTRWFYRRRQDLA